MDGPRTRRELLRTAAALGAYGIAARALPLAAAGKPSEEVAPAEDLMREHGVLRRVMFLYDEAARRLDTGAELPVTVVAAAALVIRRVIESYHEKLEEQHVFPRLEKRGDLAALVATLRRQHQAGRMVTDQIVHLAKGTLGDPGRRELAAALRSFNRMYRPHAAREDTVLFPAFHAIVGAKAYAELGEQFEDEEHRALGDEGFEKAVVEVAGLERALAMDDLDAFTPPVA